MRALLAAVHESVCGPSRHIAAPCGRVGYWVEADMTL